MNCVKKLFFEDKEYKAKDFNMIMCGPFSKTLKCGWITIIWKYLSNIERVITLMGHSQNDLQSQIHQSSSFFIDLNADEDFTYCQFSNVTSCSRPMGRNKEKMKRKQDDEKKKIMEKLKKNIEMLDSYKKNLSKKKKN